MSNFKIYQKWSLMNTGPKLDKPFVYFNDLTRMSLSTALIDKSALRPASHVLIGYDKNSNKICVKSARKQRDALKISHIAVSKEKNTLMGTLHISGILKYFNLTEIIQSILKTRIYPDIVKKGYFEFSLESLQPLLKKQNDTKTNTRKHQD